MTTVMQHDAASRSGSASPRVALASRGDALTPYLHAALERRFGAVAQIDPELTAAQRYRVAALTVRPTRDRWAERFYKSSYAARLRSANAAQRITAMAERPDVVVQVHALFGQSDLPGVLYVDCTHRQSAELWPAWNPLRGGALEAWYRRERSGYERAEHLFAFSEAARRSLVEDYDVSPDRVTVTGAGANLDPLPPRRPAVSGPPTVLFVGNDFARKGGYHLLDAFRHVRAAIPDARLLLVGTRPRVQPQPGVEVLGRIRSRDRLAALYAEATLFCLPSIYDPYPLVLLEAMAAGVPVLATEQLGVPEIVQDGVTGRLVPPKDVDALAHGILAALRDPDRSRKTARAARLNVERRFTWDAVVGRMAPALASFTSCGLR